MPSASWAVIGGGDDIGNGGGSSYTNKKKKEQFEQWVHNNFQPVLQNLTTRKNVQKRQYKVYRFFPIKVWGALALWKPPDDFL